MSDKSKKDREFAEKLKRFDAVWARVKSEKKASAAACRSGAKLMPRKGQQGRQGRYIGGR